MINAAAPSSTEPITIRIAIDNSIKSQMPLSCDNPTMNSPTACGTCCNVSTKASDCAAATMNSTRPERAAAWTKLRQAAAAVSSRNTTDPTTIAYNEAKAEISVAVAKPDLNPMKIMAIRPSETPAPNHIRRIALRESGSGGGAVEGLPNRTDTPISAAAISAAGSRPAANRPPIERLATNPRMIRLMQGGMVSAITADAASSATVEPGF